MSDLRSRVVRLAHSNPSLRGDLLPLLVGRAASAGGTVSLDTVPEQGHIHMTVRRSIPFGKVSEVAAAADAFRRDVSQLAVQVVSSAERDDAVFNGPEDIHVGDVMVGFQAGLFLEVIVRVEGPPFEDLPGMWQVIKRSGFRLGR